MEAPRQNMNKIIAQQLLEMAEVHAKDRYRKKVYSEAASKIANYPEPILSGDQAKSIPGIGNSIAAKIDEILATGRIQALQQEADPERERRQVIKLFKKIHGVGQVHAESWYSAGYRTLIDLIPLYTSRQMTAAQQLGFFYFNDLQLKIPRAEMEEIETILHRLWDPIGIEFVIAGSYRRGLPESGDIDILINQQTMTRVQEPLFQSGLIVGNLTPDAEVKSMLISKVAGRPARRMDIRIINKSSWPFALLYFTGSKNFNIVIRRWALSRGWSLSEYGLTNQAGQLVDPLQLNPPIVHEEDIFRFLELRYQPPNERTDDAQVIPLTTDVGQWVRPYQSLLVYFSNTVLSQLRIASPKKIAGFDLDSTLIHHKSGKTFSHDLNDIEIMPNRLPVLHSLISQNYVIVIFTNQKSTTENKQQTTFNKLQHVVKMFNLPIVILAALADDEYRKPEQGMWRAIESYAGQIDWPNSFFVGDAAGRPGDFKDSDKVFAERKSVRFFVPEQIFLSPTTK